MAHHHQADRALAHHGRGGRSAVEHAYGEAKYERLVELKKKRPAGVDAHLIGLGGQELELLAAETGKQRNRAQKIAAPCESHRDPSNFFRVNQNISPDR